MEESGKIVEIVGNIAKVEVVQKEICHKCPSENFCKLNTGGGRTIDARNEIGAKTGDAVKIEIGSGIILKSAFFIYIFPILSLLIAGGLTQWFGGNENLAIIIGVIALIISFLIVFFLGRKISKTKLTPVIKEIV